MRWNTVSTYFKCDIDDVITDRLGKLSNIDVLEVLIRVHEDGFFLTVLVYIVHPLEAQHLNPPRSPITQMVVHLVRDNYSATEVVDNFSNCLHSLYLESHLH